MFDPYYLPRHLNHPKRFLLFSLDEWGLLLLPLALSQVFFALWWLGLLLGLTAVLRLKQLKSREGQYYLYALCYWYLPIKIMRATPASHLRTWVG